MVVVLAVLSFKIVKRIGIEHKVCATSYAYTFVMREFYFLFPFDLLSLNP